MQNVEYAANNKIVVEFIRKNLISAISQLQVLEAEMAVEDYEIGPPDNYEFWAHLFLRENISSVMEAINRMDSKEENESTDSKEDTPA